MRKQFKSSGFTLIEIMVSTLITGILAVVITSIFIAAKNGYISNDAALEVQTDNQQAMDWIVRDIKWASQTLSSATIGGTTYSTAADELVLQVPAVDAGGDVILTATDTIVFTLDNTDIRRIVDPDGLSSRLSRNDIIANNINTLQFTYNADSIGIFVSAQKTVLFNRSINSALSTEVSFRN